MQDETTLDRSQLHAKIVTHKGHQALVFLQRDNIEKLQVIVQLWSRSVDHQVRALLDVETDDHAMVAFDSITDETIGDFVASMGMEDVL